MRPRRGVGKPRALRNLREELQRPRGEPRHRVSYKELSLVLLEIEICRNSGKIVDISRSSREAVEMNENESPDAVEFEWRFQHPVEFRQVLLPR